MPTCSICGLSTEAPDPEWMDRLMTHLFYGNLAVTFRPRDLSNYQVHHKECLLDLSQKAWNKKFGE